MDTRDWINLIMAILTLGLGVTIGLVAYSFKTAISDLKDMVNKVEKGMSEREERAFQSSKEVWIEINETKERVTKVETVQDLCKTCNNE